MTDAERGGLHVLRPTSSTVSFIAAAAVVVFLFGDAVLRGAWGIIAHWLPLALLILWALWVLLVRSSVRYDRRELVVVNGLRLHTIPWSRVVDVRRGVQLRIELDDGSVVSCFGGPFPTRPGRTTPAALDPVDELTTAQESAPRSERPALTSWDVPVAAVGIILLVATGLALALARG